MKFDKECEWWKNLYPVTKYKVASVDSNKIWKLSTSERKFHVSCFMGSQNIVQKGNKILVSPPKTNQ